MAYKVIDLMRYRRWISTSSTQHLKGVPFLHKSQGNDFVRVERDPLGQVPFHFMRVDSFVYLTNTIKDLLHLPNYRYDSVRTLLPSEGLLIRDHEIQIAKTKSPDYSQGVTQDLDLLAQEIRTDLDDVANRIASVVGTQAVCLLSGGVDSMIAAYLMSKRIQSIRTVTMTLDSRVEDAALARQYAYQFNSDHSELLIPTEEIILSFREAVYRSEIYHLYNVYCALGMLVMARRLSGTATYVVTGEGANEGFGDYHHWDVRDAKSGTTLRVQSTDIDAFKSTRGRLAYIWGNPNSSEAGFINKQLGAGLAKHGVSRMNKPMYEFGLNVLSPFMEPTILNKLASIPPNLLDQIGGKPGFMAKVFRNDIRKGEIPQSFFENRKKTRLQDGNPDGSGGLSELLLEAGLNQECAIQTFNAVFGATIRNHRRFSTTELR